jgi:phospholipase C
MFRTRWTDTTAILKLIETQLHLAASTKRDAVQMDMTECFDFTHPSWLIPPTPPVQNTSDPCYLNCLERSLSSG